MSIFDGKTDAELIAKATEARKRAHDAPKCISGTDDAPYVSGDAWARHAREWMAIEEELDRRSIEQRKKL